MHPIIIIGHHDPGLTTARILHCQNHEVMIVDADDFTPIEPPPDKIYIIERLIDYIPEIILAEEEAAEYPVVKIEYTEPVTPFNAKEREYG